MLRSWVVVLGGVGLASVALGLSWSHSLVSIGVGLLMGVGLVGRDYRRALGASFREAPVPLGALVGLYGLHLLSGFYTENIPQWLTELRIKLPLLLLLPATLVVMRAMPQKVQGLVLWLLHGGLLVVGLGTALKALNNFEWALEEMRQGRYVPFVGGISHIYYAAHVLSALLLLPVTPGKGHWRWIVAAAYLLIIHVLALRTALLGLYGGLVLGLVYWAIKRRAWGWGLLGLLSGLVVFLALVRYWGPLRSRYEHIMRDIQQYRMGNLYYLTVGTRLAALEASWLVFRKSPWWGVGIADNQDEVHAAEASLPYEWGGGQFYLLPHNQFVEYAIGFGIIGLGTFLAFWIGAFRWQRSALWWWWLGVWILMMQVEALLERQMGLTMFLWGSGILLARLGRLSS